MVLEYSLLILNSLRNILLKWQSLVARPKMSRVLVVLVLNRLAPELDGQVALGRDARGNLEEH